MDHQWSAGHRLAIAGLVHPFLSHLLPTSSKRSRKTFWRQGVGEEAANLSPWEPLKSPMLLDCVVPQPKNVLVWV